MVHSDMFRVFAVFVAVIMLAVVYAYLVDFDRRGQRISELSEEVTELRACREAANAGYALAWAWHDWLGEHSQHNVDRVHDLQREQGEHLVACRARPAGGRAYRGGGVVIRVSMDISVFLIAIGIGFLVGAITGRVSARRR